MKKIPVITSLRWPQAFLAILVIQGCGGGSSQEIATPATYTIGGTVSGLTPGSSVVLQNNNADAITIAANAVFTFDTHVANSGSYSVTVSTQPSGQTCQVSGGTGTVMAANITNIGVLCPSETVLWTFAPSGVAGSGSEAVLIQASDGNFYGTTSSDGAYNIGTVFKVTPEGVESTLWNFGGTSTDAQEPLAGLLQGSDGLFYGTTFAGGAIGGGTAFSLTPAGVEHVLWSFGAPGDGNSPTAPLIQGSDGNFYGTTAGGGTNGTGTVFKISPAGAETVLWSFGSTQADGQVPWGGVIEASDGNLYGTTVNGGANNLGTVYRVTKSGVETVVWNFGSGSDGATPYGPLVQAADGNFYGLTQGGGAAHVGAGYRLTMAGAETVLWNLDLTTGAAPVGGLVQGADGAFYGTGGRSVFRATTSGELLVIWNDFPQSSGPYAGVIQGTDGAFYGTTEGYTGATPGPSGIVFRIAL